VRRRCRERAVDAVGSKDLGETDTLAVISAALVAEAADVYARRGLTSWPAGPPCTTTMITRDHGRRGPPPGFGLPSSFDP